MLEFLNIQPNSIDPNMIYLVLVLGLWVSVTAIKVPGTGVLELIAIVALVAAGIFMTALSTNWLAVLMVVIGLLTFIVAPFLQLDRHSDLLALGGLALQAVGSFLLFSAKPVSWVLIIVALVIQLAYFRYLLLPILERIRGQEVIDRDSQIIGAEGRVVKALNPVGTVNIDAELWTATSDQPLEAGEVVVVVEREGLQLFVERVKQKHVPEDTDEDIAEEAF